jgi:hypothetical protein
MCILNHKKPKKPVSGCKCEHCVNENEKRTSIPDTFTEYGTFASGQGVRIDIEGFVDETKKGKSRMELIDEGYGTLVARYHNLYIEDGSFAKPTSKTKFIVNQVSFRLTGRFCNLLSIKFHFVLLVGFAKLPSSM